MNDIMAEAYDVASRSARESQAELAALRAMHDELVSEVEDYRIVWEVVRSSDLLCDNKEDAAIDRIEKRRRNRQLIA